MSYLLSELKEEQEQSFMQICMSNMVKAKKDVKRPKDEELDIEDLMSTANYIYL
jgi:hypothetical protein